MLPEGLEIIGGGVFFECESLKEVVLPSTLREIPNKAFGWKCNKLERIVLPEGLEIIGEDAFHGCESLKEVTLPTTLREIYPGAFYSCSGIKRVEIPDSIEGLSSGAAFSNSTTVALGMRNRIRKKFGLIREISPREI